MMNSSLGVFNATQDYHDYNNTNDLYVHAEGNTYMVLGRNVWISISFITCCVGLVGNGYIIWLLGFQMKRNCFTTFILNLAIADFGYITCAFIDHIDSFTNYQANDIFYLFLEYFNGVMFINSNLLLTAISIDRCVCVLFPIWHRCSRPKDLSSVVCIILWIFSMLLSGIMSVTEIFPEYHLSILYFLLTAVVCLPLITISTLVLFIKVCLKPKQKNKGRVLLMILITLLCFLILDFPLCVFGMIVRFSSTKFDKQLVYWMMCTVLFSSLNSSINPVIYFLVGRKKGARSKESMKVILQNVFKEGEATRGEIEELKHTSKTSVFPPEY